MSKRVNPKECPKCGKVCSWFTGKVCHNCYRKYKWKPKKKICRRCKRLIKMQAKGYCPGCYNTVFHLERTKAWNHKRNYNLDYKTYKRITSHCLICGFNKYVDLHHLDGNHKNNSHDNLIGLCPNHHQMLHTLKWRDEVLDQINKILKLNLIVI